MKLAMILLVLFSCSLHAEIKIYDFKDPALEQRYQGLTEELRCLVCQNQNIADSHAELAEDLRGKVYELLNKGETDAQIVEYMTNRYGDFVLYRPPLKSKTLILWLAPILTVLLGAFGFWAVLRKRDKPQEHLSDTERQRIEELLKRKSE
ncbi:MAG: cytochrome c-type biogenesis protein CcmH [Methylococcaceae bacterium]|jgi:cytochrome c-type biogenesis protein CcmH|nr:cytochrome c-type biogenesis protein CcmH [Methylococcaceae bacterium]MDZ4157173.1 cytochrome c-type biogenesis protein [Methylococcales bacterium]MDP2394867.1 cytochrome c-type biogenesis protein CcmH [Methylococcaceae bacterium]MDP3020288.1 cytochrome c-type biogenesis protein CcmH [Methylococcaceae bacterium]MDP3390829.1 cytochrome c-type biogenesis protein CcmH [Methylococcaceae bacterium]